MALFGPNPNISFFPEKRVRLISERLGHDRLEHLLEEIRKLVASKMKLATSIPRSKAFQGHQSEPPQGVLPHESLKAHILGWYINARLSEMWLLIGFIQHISRWSTQYILFSVLRPFNTTHLPQIFRIYWPQTEPGLHFTMR